MPGGGAAAALAGALGVALCEMSANFTVGNKRYADVEPEMKSIVERAEKIRVRFLELADEDAEVFPAVSAAWRLRQPMCRSSRNTGACHCLPNSRCARC